MILSCGKPVSRMILGGDRLTARKYFLPDPSRRSECYAILDAAWELGINAFDTARSYGGSERVLGDWIRARGNRSEVFLCTKLACPTWRSRSRLSPREIRSDFHKSLRALQTDHVDLLMPHYDDPSVPVEMVIQEVGRFVVEGKVRMIGASNWDYRRVLAANEYAVTSGLLPISAVSVNFGLLPWERAPWPGAQQISGAAHEAARQFYARTQIPVLAWASLGFGFFADEYDPQTPNPTGRTRWISKVFGSAENYERLRRVRRFAREAGVSAAQVALAFILAQDFPTYCIVGCRSRVKLEDCVGALRIQLSRETQRELLLV